MNVLAEPAIRPSPEMIKKSSVRSPVVGGMSYVQSFPDAIHPCSYTFQPPDGIPWENVAYEKRFVPIFDRRMASMRPTIEKEGFELWDAPTRVKNFFDVDEVLNTYYREAGELAVAVTGAKRAYIFDHLVRKRDTDQGDLRFGRRIADGTAAANGRIHNDYTEASGRRRLELVIKDSGEASRVMRYSIVNIWRPIRGPVLDTPLALCDARTLAARDFVICDVKYPDRTGEIYLASYSDAHCWSYFSRMEPHEALVFKQYDSQTSGTSRFTPHAAFDHPEAPGGCPPRQSIELRCLVTY